MPVPSTQCHIYLPRANTCESSSTFNYEKALVGAFSVIVKYQLYYRGSLSSEGSRVRRLEVPGDQCSETADTGKKFPVKHLIVSPLSPSL